MFPVTRRGLVYGVLALSFGCAVAGRILTAVSVPLDPGDPDSAFQIALETVWLGYGVLGALILASRPRHPIGWVLLGSGAAIGFGHLGAGYAAYALDAEPDLPGAAVGLWLPSTLWAPALLVPLIFVPLLCPDGRVPGPRWRPWACGAAGLIALWCAGWMFAAGPLDEPPGLDNPFGVHGAETLQYVAPGLLLAVGCRSQQWWSGGDAHKGRSGSNCAGWCSPPASSRAVWSCWGWPARGDRCPQ